MTGPLQGCRPAADHLLVRFAPPCRKIDSCSRNVAVPQIAQGRVKARETPARLALRAQIKRAINADLPSVTAVARYQFDDPDRIGLKERTELRIG